MFVKYQVRNNRLWYLKQIIATTLWGLDYTSTIILCAYLLIKCIHAAYIKAIYDFTLHRKVNNDALFKWEDIKKLNQYFLTVKIKQLFKFS